MAERDAPRGPHAPPHPRARAHARTCRLTPRARPPLLTSRDALPPTPAPGAPAGRAGEGRGREGAGGDTGCSGAVPKARVVPRRQAQWGGAPGPPEAPRSPALCTTLVFSPFPGAGRDWHTPKLPLRFRLRPDRASLGRRDPEETGSALGGWSGRETLNSWKESFRSPRWRDVPLTPRGVPRLGASRPSEGAWRNGPPGTPGLSWKLLPLPPPSPPPPPLGEYL